MSNTNMDRLANKLQDVELCLKSQHDQEAIYTVYAHALREAILSMDDPMEVEVLKSLGDLHLEKGKLSKDSAEFDKAAALYAAALLRCTDPDMGQILEDELEDSKHCMQLLPGHSPQYQSQHYQGTAVNMYNVLRVAQVCDKLDRSTGNSQCPIGQVYTEMLVTAIENNDVLLEVEVLKSLGDFYLNKGKKTSKVSQFSKAATMYKKALTRCGGPETKLTLEHRILYLVRCLLDKIRQIERRQAQSKKLRVTDMRPYREDQLGSIPRPDIFQDRHLLPDETSQYSDHLKEGDSSLARAELDSAEQHFAAALRDIYVSDPTAQQYQREVEPLCKLGDVYSKRGQQTGDGGDFVKAAALYNAAIARSEDQLLNGNKETAIREVEKLFLNYILGINCNVSQEDTEKHKKQLKEMRDQIKLEMETIDQQLDPYVHDEDDPRVKEIEAKRAQAVRNLFENIAQQRKEFIGQLVEECIGLMGPPPCKYALIGLGSQATGLVTPYSDLEFAILVEEESEECLVYFHNITHYLHLKVVNLGETILPALGIKSLNNFYSEDPLDNWYYDSVTLRGFAFDGSMPKASKTPLGRQGTMNEPPSELICTPENMASILQKDVKLYLKKEYHLATILRNPCLIAGDKDLIDTYKAITGEILQADGGKMAQQLVHQTLKENNDIYKNLGSITASLIDVKKEIYRFPAVAVDCLALSSGIIPTTVWETIEEMEHQQVISPNNTHHLTVLTSISAELRLRTYIANGGQKENLSALASIETAVLGQQSSLDDDMLKPVFHLPNEKQLFRYYYTAVPLKTVFSKWSRKNPVKILSSSCYENSLTVKGRMYSELCKDRVAITYYNKALKTTENTDTEKMQLYSYLAHSWDRVGDYHKSINYYEQALQINRSIYGYSTTNSNFVASLQGLSVALFHQGDHRKAMLYSKQALQMYRSIYGPTTAHPAIANALSNLGVAHLQLGGYKQAVIYHEQALKMRKSIYGQSTPHPDIALSCTNIGNAWNDLADYKKAISYLEQALKMCKGIFGDTSAHPYIALSLNNVGKAWYLSSNNQKAISYYEQALKMYRSIYGENTAHADIATLLSNIGVAWRNSSNFKKAIIYHEQALQMYRSIHGQTTPHGDIAKSLNKLGNAWKHMGDYKKAINYHEHALKICRDIYGEVHPDTALSLNHMGDICSALGNFRTALSYYEQALQIKRSIYGQSTAHPGIALSFNDLGLTCLDLGDYRRAISYHEQALQMYRSVHGQTTAHPDIACLLNNLATVYCYLQDDRKAISYCEQALGILRRVYGQSTAHADIAITLNNLAMACGGLGNYKKMISYYEKALQMNMAIYGENTSHPGIANSLHNLGAAWSKLADYQKAISYHEQALQMYRSIYGPSAAHPDIFKLLSNLGLDWHYLGDHRTALSLCQEALDMAMQVYPQDKTHPSIKQAEHNLTKISAALAKKYSL